MASRVTSISHCDDNANSFFLVSGQGGHVLPFEPVVRDIAGWNCFGILHPGFFADEPELATVEALATRMRRDVLAETPEGPFFLVGYSFGGLVCLEMARQLRDAGEVGLLIIDTRLAGCRVPLPLARRAILHVMDIRQGGLTSLTKKIRRRLPKTKSSGSDETSRTGMASQLRKIGKSADEARRKYVPQPCNVPTILVRSRAAPSDRFSRITPNLGWDQVCDLRKTMVVDGTHLNMFKGERRREFARILQENLCQLSQLVTGAHPSQSESFSFPNERNHDSKTTWRGDATGLGISNS